MLVRHQLLILNRSRKRSPNLRVYDRVIAGLCTFLMRPARVLKSAIVLKPSTLLRFHKLLVKRKYRASFFAQTQKTTGSEETGPGTHRRRRCNETPESHLGLSSNCPADLTRVRRRDRQRRCRQDSRRTFSARIGKFRSVMAHVPWAYKRQFVERRSVSSRNR